MSTSSSKKLLLFISLCLGIASIKAQYRIDQWTADDGLPQNSVYAIVQTADGYLWVATVDGLARFDGVRFTIFNKSNSPGIVNNRFISLSEDADHNLWAGTEESGAVRFTRGRFDLFGSEAGVPRNVNWIESDANGAGTIFHGPVETVHYQGGEFLPVDQHSNLSHFGSELPKSEKMICRRNSVDKVSECFVGDQWVRFSLEGTGSPGKFLSVEQNTNLDGSIPVRFVSAAKEANGQVWAITADGRLAHAENGKVERIYGERDGLPKYPLYMMVGERLGLVAKDVDGSLWLIDLPSMHKELLLKKNSIASFPLDKIEFLSTYADREGDLWFGTKRDGLFRARKQVISTYSKAEGIEEKTVYPVYQDRAGTIWTGGAGLYKREGDKFVSIRSTEKFAVSAISENDAGRILISNFGAIFIQENDQFVPFEPDKIASTGFIYAIHEDPEKAIWIGSAGGLRRLKDGVVTSFSVADGLAGNDVKTIIDSHFGGLWIGTYGGLTRYENGRLKSWREEDGLPSGTVRCLFEDADGTLWIGSYDGGFARFKDGKFTRYDMKIGLPNDGAFQILEDDSRHFWISSNRGIYSVSRDDLDSFAEGKIARVNPTAYGKSDGMLSIECNGGRWPAGIRANDGRLWFPTQDGLAVIEPQNIKSNSQPPPVVIETVKVDNELIEPHVAANALDRAQPDDSTDSAAYSGGGDLTVNPNQQNLEIKYTALSFINSENLRFKYKLEGLDDDWVDAGTRRQAYFSHIPPGSYTFHVIAANSDNVWNEKGAALKIVVLSPFYRTSWFLILAVFVIGAFAYLMFRRRVTQINLKHAAEVAFSRRLIDSQEQERKRFAAEMHDGLGQSLVIIKNRARLSLKQPDQKTAMLDHLESISETASHAIHEAKEIAFNLRPHLLDRLGLTKTIESMLDKVFGASGIELTTAVDQIDGVLEKDSEILLYRIVQECASNIVKHSEAENAVIRIAHNEQVLTVKIVDDGRGFDPSTGKDDLAKRSFGLVGIAERTRLLGGKLKIESEPGKGTTVSIKIG
ncbi:MAG: two-component regulator propeller domain-containing protein [Acidobacteriota bacterium]